MDTKFTDRDIVGWYHSHPNFGIFLSDRDCFIQDHFFNGPGQIAYVVDPVNGVEGRFRLARRQGEAFPHFWVGDEVHLSTQGAARKPSSAPPAGQSSASAPKSDALPPLSSSMTWILVALCFLLLGYIVGSKLTAWERGMLIRGVVAHYGLFKGLKPGMREQLDRSRRPCAEDHAGRRLARQGTYQVPFRRRRRKKRRNNGPRSSRLLLLTDKDIEEINSLYSLTPEETAEVQQLINAKEAEVGNVQVPDGQGFCGPRFGAESGEREEQRKRLHAGQAASAPPAKPIEGKPAETKK